MQLWADVESGQVAAGGTVAAVVTLMVWLITKGIPSMMERHEAAQKDQRADFLAELHRRTEAGEKQAEISRAQQALLAERYERVVEGNTKAINEFRVSLHRVVPVPQPP